MCQPTESSNTAQNGTVLQQAVSRSDNGLAKQSMMQLNVLGAVWLPYDAMGLHQVC